MIKKIKCLKSTFFFLIINIVVCALFAGSLRTESSSQIDCNYAKLIAGCGSLAMQRPTIERE